MQREACLGRGAIVALIMRMTSLGEILTFGLSRLPF